MTTVNGAPRLVDVEQRTDTAREDEKAARKAALIRANARWALGQGASSSAHRLNVEGARGTGLIGTSQRPVE